MADQELSGKKLDIAYWYVSHKLLLRNIFIVVLLVFIFLYTAYLLFILGYYFSVQRTNYLAILTDFTKNNSDQINLKSLTLPQPVDVTSLQTFTSSQGVDIVAEISNPNPVWYAEFTYYFKSGTEETSPQPGFIFPQTSKNLISLGNEQGKLGSNLQLVISDLEWKKEISFEDKFLDRYRFEIENIRYLSPSDLAIGNESNVSRLVFTAKNSSGYNFKNVKFLIFLKSGSNIVAVNQVVVERFESYQSQNLYSTFFQRLPNVNDADIIPEINILDDSVILE